MDQFLVICLIYIGMISFSFYSCIRLGASRIITGKMNWDLVAITFGGLSACCLLCWLIFKIEIKW